ncbi:hypothetical protein ABIE33_002629 [Ensifer sp. 4252]
MCGACVSAKALFVAPSIEIGPLTHFAIVTTRGAQ